MSRTIKSHTEPKHIYIQHCWNGVKYPASISNPEFAVLIADEIEVTD